MGVKAGPKTGWKQGEFMDNSNGDIILLVSHKMSSLRGSRQWKFPTALKIINIVKVLTYLYSIHCDNSMEEIALNVR
jgi:hypothetical protein